MIQVGKEYEGRKQSTDQPAHMRHMGGADWLGCNRDDKVGCEGNDCTATKHRPAHNKATTHQMVNAHLLDLFIFTSQHQRALTASLAEAFHVHQAATARACPCSRSRFRPTGSFASCKGILHLLAHSLVIPASSSRGERAVSTWGWTQSS